MQLYGQLAFTTAKDLTVARTIGDGRWPHRLTADEVLIESEIKQLRHRNLAIPDRDRRPGRIERLIS